MSVQGSLKTMSPVDVLGWLERRGLAGDLTVERAGTSRRFQVARGAVTSASSTDPAEYLGQMLLNAGHITEDLLREAFALQAQTGTQIGKILVDRGRVAEAALREILEVKIREGVYDAMSWEDGAFVFEPDDGAPRLAQYGVEVPIAVCLTDGAERATQWKAIRAAIPRPDLRFFVPDRSWLQRARPGSPSALVLEDVQHGLTVREIILERHALTFQVYQRVFELLQRGIIQPDRRAGGRDEPPPGTERTDPLALVEAARGRARGGDRRGAVELARRALEAAPADEHIKRTYQELERSLFAELSRALLKKFRVPRLLKAKEELAALELTAEERYLVGRIDGRWDLLSLMRVSPLREVEALITFQRLAERGLIALE